MVTFTTSTECRPWLITCSDGVARATALRIFKVRLFVAKVGRLDGLSPLGTPRTWCRLRKHHPGNERGIHYATSGWSGERHEILKCGMRAEPNVRLVCCCADSDERNRRGIGPICCAGKSCLKLWRAQRMRECRVAWSECNPRPNCRTHVASTAICSLLGPLAKERCER
jgi:hypothetical protein